MSHASPLVNGYSGYFPPHYAALRFGLGMRDDDVLSSLGSLGVTQVVVNAHEDRDGRWKRYVEAHPGVTVACAEQDSTLFRLPQLAGLSRLESGSLLRVATVRATVNDGDVRLMMDGDRATRWQSGPQSDRTAIDIDLGVETDVSQIELLLGPYVEDFHRQLSIEMLGPGAVWKELYKGGTAGRTFVAAFESPKDVPLRFSFDPPAHTRFLRLRTLTNDETYYWSIAEIKIRGR